MNKFTYNDWTICFHGRGGAKEDSIPALLAVGNGRIGIRATVPEVYPPHGRGIFLAGFYDRLPRPRLKPESFTPFLRSWSHMDLVDGYHLEETLVNCPDFLNGYFTVDGELLSFDQTRADRLYRSLCLKTGELVFEIPLSAPSGKFATLRRRRFAHMGETRQVRELCELRPGNFSGQIRYHGHIDEPGENCNISGIYQSACGQKKRHWFQLYDVLEQVKQESLLMLLISGRVYGAQAAFAVGTMDEAGQFVSEEGALCVQRVGVFGCDTMGDDLNVTPLCLKAMQTDYYEALSQSAAVWKELWEDSDLIIDGDSRAQVGIRHSLYQLLISCCRENSRVSVAAKGLTGEGYRGMTFWDTDIHMFPFYLYTQPQMARNIVEFRCRTLDGAREKAKKYGNQGASYPWETGVSGKEECESFLKLITHQLHITADVAYALGRHWDAAPETPSAEITETLLETARFWQSKSREREGLLSIPQASGPDELHLESDDNAYVNNMAANNLALADRAAAHMDANLPQEFENLLRRLELSRNDWAAITQDKGRIRCMKGADGLYEQCEGFFDLEDRIVYEDSETDAPCDTQTVKQADVLMLLYLLPDLVTSEELRRNWDYYEPRTIHTSSLSYGVHSILAARLGLAEKAAYYLERSLGIDLISDTGSCADGAHLAAAGMSWSAIIEGMGGVQLRDGRLTINPALPHRWRCLCVTLQYRGMRISLTIEKKRIKATRSEDGGPDLLMLVMEQEGLLKSGEELYLCY